MVVVIKAGRSMNTWKLDPAFNIDLFGGIRERRDGWMDVTAGGAVLLEKVFEIDLDNYPPSP